MTALPPSTPSRIGVLLVNLGTPDAPDRAALKRYLKEFLSDPRVVEIPKLVWWPILNGVILTTRPAKSAEKYAQIWTGDGSPLLVHTRELAERLQARFAQAGRADVDVAFAMRYGQPSVKSVLNEMAARGCGRILVAPLYPQYAGSSTASALDAVYAALMDMRAMPALRVLRDYHDDPGYIQALAASVREHWQAHGTPDRLLMSFHGVPCRTIRKGDPYYQQCQATGRLLAQALALSPEQYGISFQSRFGRAAWIQPATTDVLAEWGGAGVGRVDVVCPGFAADCLETLEEIELQERDTFIRAGGRDYRYIPALNAREDWVAALHARLSRELSGWEWEPERAGVPADFRCPGCACQEPPDRRRSTASTGQQN